MAENSRWSRFWDESVARSGHTGYGEAILHRYDQPVRLATVRRIIRKLFPDGLRDRAVLDIGCGTGDFMALSLGQGAVTVDGVDVSPQVLAKATSRFTADARVRLRQGTVIEQVCEQGRYDLITSITVLQHHVEDAELIQALGALRDALKPDGRIIVLELAPPHEVENRQYNRGVQYLVERPPQAWHAAFSASGLRIISEPVMPQLGIACLRAITWMIGLVRKSKTATTADQNQGVVTEGNLTEQQEQPLSLKRRTLQTGFQWARRFTLWVCYPLDHWLRLPLPPPRFRTYRIFVLAKADVKSP